MQTPGAVGEAGRGFPRFAETHVPGGRALVGAPQPPAGARREGVVDQGKELPWEGRPPGFGRVGGRAGSLEPVGLVCSPEGGRREAGMGRPFRGWGLQARSRRGRGWWDACNRPATGSDGGPGGTAVSRGVWTAGSSGPGQGAQTGRGGERGQAGEHGRTQGTAQGMVLGDHDRRGATEDGGVGHGVKGCWGQGLGGHTSAGDHRPRAGGRLPPPPPPPPAGSWEGRAEHGAQGKTRGPLGLFRWLSDHTLCAAGPTERRAHTKPPTGSPLADSDITPVSTLQPRQLPGRAFRSGTQPARPPPRAPHTGPLFWGLGAEGTAQRPVLNQPSSPQRPHQEVWESTGRPHRPRPLGEAQGAWGTGLRFWGCRAASGLRLRSNSVQGALVGVCECVPG